ncbi:MAG: protein ligase [Rhodobacteraceae bacterium]|nr:protein ligase [Paracoccaceae bacterium]
MAKVSENPAARYLWFWQSPQSLVAPQKFEKKPGFAVAAQTLATASWPVSLRSTGGDVTPQGAGIVNVTHVYASEPTKAFDLHAAYDALCRPIEAALGAGASRGWQPGAFCDGEYNVQWQGLKFAGTAMRFRPCRADKSRYAILAHALMLIEPPSEAAIGALNTFLHILEEPRQIALEAHTGLPPGTSQPGFVDALTQEFATLNDTPLEVLA